MIEKNLWGSLSLPLIILSNAPYIFSIITGKTKPHLFTHVIWGLAGAIAFAGQHAAHAGPGAWSSGLSALSSVGIAALALKYGESTITHGDWIALIVGLGALLLWYMTANPLPAVILATLTDTVAYYPTFRKSYDRPHQEMAYSYCIANVRHVTAVLAMTEYSVTTLFPPVVLLMMNSALVIMLIWRRRRLAPIVPSF